MKKIMFMFAAVAVAVATQAASINWGITANSWYLSNGSTKAAQGTTVYLIDLASSAAIENAINKNGKTSFTAADTGIIGLGTTSNAKGYIASIKADSDKLTAGTKYDFAYLVFDTAASKYFISGEVNKAAWQSGDPTYGETQTITFGTNEYSNGEWKSIEKGDIPEPTSGLLFLVGGSLLALRRRRA